MHTDKVEIISRIQKYSSFLYDEEISAKHEFFRLYGKPVPDDPFYETRMELFYEWFFMTRKTFETLTIMERVLAFPEKFGFSDDFYVYKHHIFELVSSYFGIFELMAPWKKRKVWFRDLLFGTEWLITHWPPFVSLEPGQIIQARLIPEGEYVEFGNGFVIHDINVRDEIHALLKIFSGKNISSDIISALFAKLHITSFRYSHLNPKRFYNLSDPLIKDTIRMFGLL